MTRDAILISLIWETQEKLRKLGKPYFWQRRVRARREVLIRHLALYQKYLGRVPFQREEIEKYFSGSY